MRSFCPKRKMYELKVYRGVIYKDTEVWWKIWREIDLSFLWWILTRVWKCSGVIFHGTQDWWKIWRKADSWFGKWQREFGKFSPGYSKVSKLGLWWDPFIQKRKCMSLKTTEELYVMTLKNDAKFGEELTCRFKIDMYNFTDFNPSTRKSQKFGL